MSAAVAAHGDALNFDTPLNQPDKQLWGQLRLTGWEPKGQHPLASEQPNSAKLMGNGELIVGRNAQSVLRLHKSLVWCSNKHFVLQRDSQTGQVTVRDTSSNGTWVNGERVDKQVARVLKHGDHIELAAEEGTEFRQPTEAAAADVGACSPRTGAVDAGAADAESQEAKKWNATGIDY